MRIHLHPRPAARLVVDDSIAAPPPDEVVEVRYWDGAVPAALKAIEELQLENIRPRAIVAGRRAYLSIRVYLIGLDLRRQDSAPNYDQIAMSFLPQLDDADLKIFDVPVYCHPRCHECEVLAVAGDRLATDGLRFDVRAREVARARAEFPGLAMMGDTLRTRRGNEGDEER